jgi:Protein of unknown function (DUF2934)
MSRLADPNTNEFHCNACGRFFNSQAELSAHEIECRTAKAATPAGAKNLAEEDARPHPKNDVEVRNGEVSVLAYSYWEARGGEHGGDQDDWFRAERELGR